MKKSYCQCRDFGYCFKYRQSVGENGWIACQRTSEAKIEQRATNPRANRFPPPAEEEVKKVKITDKDFAIELEAIKFLEIKNYNTIITRKLETHRNDVEKYLRSINVQCENLIMYTTERWFCNSSDCTEEELYLQSHEIANFFAGLEYNIFIVASCGIASLINKKTGKKTICLPRGTVYE